MSRLTSRIVPMLIVSIAGLCAACDDDDTSSAESAESADAGDAKNAKDGGATPSTDKEADKSKPRATTSYGPVSGTVDDKISVFKGIRYGADTQTTRFAAPAEPKKWTEVAEATAFGDTCP